MTNSYETIRVSRRDGVAELLLNRPERLNAISRRMVEEVGRALDGLERDDSIGAVVVAGAGRAFCAGFDLKDDAAAGVGGVAGWRRVLQADFDFITRLWRFPKPTIAAVHGYCLAGGCELAMCCDLTIAAEGCFFGEPELRFGSVITAMIMPWLTGPKLAKELLLTGNDRITAARAERIGLVNEVVPDGEQLARAHALGRQMATVDREALILTKAAINRAFETMGLWQALQAGLDTAVQIECLETPERQAFKELVRAQGLKAALEWRDRRFAGPDDEAVKGTS